jgi:hypothetical protein
MRTNLSWSAKRASALVKGLMIQPEKKMEQVMRLP